MIMTEIEQGDNKVLLTFITLGSNDTEAIGEWIKRKMEKGHRTGYDLAECIEEIKSECATKYGETPHITDINDIPVVRFPV